MFEKKPPKDADAIGLPANETTLGELSEELRESTPQALRAASIAQPPADERKTVEEHAVAESTHPAIFAAAQAYHKWGIGQRFTGDEYKSAIDKVANLEMQ